MFRIVLAVIAAAVPLAAGTVSCMAISAVVPLHYESASMPAGDLVVDCVNSDATPVNLTVGLRAIFNLPIASIADALLSVNEPAVVDLGVNAFQPVQEDPTTLRWDSLNLVVPAYGSGNLFLRLYGVLVDSRGSAAIPGLPGVLTETVSFTGDGAPAILNSEQIVGFVQPVPEPTGFVLAGLGLLGIAIRRRLA